MNHQKYFKPLLILAVLFVILLRLPSIYLWSNSKVTGEDGALYLETAENLAKGNGYYSSTLRHITNKEIASEYLQKYGLTDRMEWIPPLFIVSSAAVYWLSGSNDIILSANILNLFLFILFIFLYTRYLRKEYPDNYFETLFSILIIGMTFSFFEFSFGPHLEPIYLLTFFIAFLQHKRIILKEKLTAIDYLFYSISIALFLFSKYSAIPFVGAFFIHFLVKKRIKETVIVAILQFIFIVPWMFIRSYLISGHPLSQRIRGQFPFSDLPQYSGFVNDFVYSVYALLRNISNIIEYYVSIDGFFYLLPFALAVIIVQKKSLIPQISKYLFCGAIIFFLIIYNFGSSRYQFLLLVPIVPFALIELNIYLKNNFNKNRKVILSFLVLLFFWIQFFNITEYYNLMRKVFPVKTSVIEKSIDIINKNIANNNSSILINTPGVNVFVENPVVLVPKHMNTDNKKVLIEFYQLNYVLFHSGEAKLGNDIFTDYELIDTRMENNIKLYRVKK